MANSFSSKEKFVTFASLNVSLGLFLQIYSTSVFNSIQEVLEKHIFPDSSITLRSLFASSPLLGAFIGSLFAGSLASEYGRRSTMIFTNLLSIFGVILTMIPNAWLFILGRVITSLDGGASMVLVNIYITEICKDPLRGQLGAIPAIASSLGVLIGFLLGGTMPFFIEHGQVELGYRLLIGLPRILNVYKLFNLIFFFRFETPFYLVTQKKETEARDVLELLYDDEYTKRLNEVISERDCICGKTEISWKELFKPKYRTLMIVGVLLSGSVSFMGGNGPLIFSNMIFSEGMETSYTDNTLLLTNMVAIIELFGSGAGLLFFRWSGRRRVLGLAGTIALVAINLVITLIIYMDSISNMSVKILILIWVAVAASSILPLSYFYVAEILPEIGVSMLNALSIALSFLMVQTYLPLQMLIGYGGLYLSYTFLTVVSALIFIFYFVETQNKSKEEIYRHIEKPSREECEPLISVEN